MIALILIYWAFHRTRVFFTNLYCLSQPWSRSISSTFPLRGIMSIAISYARKYSTKAKSGRLLARSVSACCREAAAVLSNLAGESRSL
jgi:hypothetical protein